ncbi:hypothetical protein [Weissella paramesenteroides]|uniref:hypothetical protein n=1 Tax=Weissella paramesenteroides TaxID=1249 RepID=UPI003D35B536
MAITFDEAVKRLAKHINSKDLTISVTDVDEILSDLRTTYAPTIEMTSFERTNAVGLLDFKRDELTFVVGENSDGKPVLDTLPKRYFSAWLHPETIKVVE